MAQTHQEIIERIGRPKDIAEALDVPRVYVSQWKKRGIPWKYRPAIAEMATFKLPANFLKPGKAA